MEQHTAGPWESNDFQIVAKNDEVIANVRYGSNKYENHAANARIISAAPDMLDALETFIEYEQAMNEQDDVSGMLIYAEFARMARAAIAKATGKQ